MGEYKAASIFHVYGLVKPSKPFVCTFYIFVVLSLCAATSFSLKLLQRLEDFKGSVQAGEVQRTRLLLRVGAIEAYTQQRYSDALLQVLHSYLLARSFYTSYQSMPLEGEMVRNSSLHLSFLCSGFRLPVGLVFLACGSSGLSVVRKQKER